MENIKIVGISGSLRKDSYNTSLLKASQELLPEGTSLEIADISQLPLYNEDIESPLPEAVAKFKDQVASADAILFVSPEYNYSIPGGLKNAIDWASRPYGQNSFSGKPALIMGASMGNIATARMQYHLRQVLVFLDVHPLNKPEVMVGTVQDKVSADGKLTDQKTAEYIRNAISALKDWTIKLK